MYYFLPILLFIEESITISPPANIEEIPDIGITGLTPVNGSAWIPNTVISSPPGGGGVLRGGVLVSIRVIVTPASALSGPMVTSTSPTLSKPAGTVVSDIIYVPHARPSKVTSPPAVNFSGITGLPLSL